MRNADWNQDTDLNVIQNVRGANEKRRKLLKSDRKTSVRNGFKEQTARKSDTREYEGDDESRTVTEKGKDTVHTREKGQESRESNNYRCEVTLKFTEAEKSVAGWPQRTSRRI